MAEEKIPADFVHEVLEAFGVSSRDTITKRICDVLELHMRRRNFNIIFPYDDEGLVFASVEDDK